MKTKTEIYADTTLYRSGFYGCLQILQRERAIQLLQGELNAALHIGPLITELHVALDPVEQLRCDGEVSGVGIAIRHLANVLIHPKNFLDHHDRTFGLTGRYRLISAQGKTVY